MPQNFPTVSVSDYSRTTSPCLYKSLFKNAKCRRIAQKLCARLNKLTIITQTPVKNKEQKRRQVAGNSIKGYNLERQENQSINKKAGSLPQALHEAVVVIPNNRTEASQRDFTSAMWHHNHNVRPVNFTTALAKCFGSPSSSHCRLSSKNDFWDRDPRWQKLAIRHDQNLTPKSLFIYATFSLNNLTKQRTQ